VSFNALLINVFSECTRDGLAFEEPEWRHFAADASPSEHRHILHDLYESTST
jgi:hypothetical protein